MKIRLPGNSSYCILAVVLLLQSLSSSGQGVYRFWGMTRQGGVHNTGVLFSLDSNGTHYSVNHEFTLSNPGASPYYTQLAEWNGKYYGVTIAGGDNKGYGVIFEWDPATNIYTKKFDFSPDDCWFPYGSLTLSGNKFYGMTNRGGEYGLGVIFEWNPATNAFVTRYSFDDDSGHSPEGSLTALFGRLYGMTRAGGAYYGGVIFQFDPSTGNYTKKYEFDYDDGRSPHGELTWARGRFYGLTAEGGADGYGVIFEWNPQNNKYINKFSFNGANGKYPYGSLTRFQNKLYGMTTEGGSGNGGVLFAYDLDGSGCSSKLEFGGGLGMVPYGKLTVGNQTLAGMTWMGGAGNYGALFEFDPVTNSVVHTREFADPLNGSNPMGSLVWNGNSFYGLTSSGGTANSGVIFEWDPANDEYTKKIDFNAAENGSLPQGNLLKWRGRLYGTTTRGGSANQGIFFSYDETTQTFTRLFDFNGANGAEPTGDLAIYNGRIYGWTREGGQYDRGTIFEWNPATQTHQVLYSFDYSTGAYPSAGPLLWNDKFYGTTVEGGANGMGVIYVFDPATVSYERKFDFDGAHGANPTGCLVARNHLLYGMTTYGGDNETGVIYQWDPAGNNFSTRYHFQLSGLGVHPRAGLTLSEDGSVFYGMTRETNGNISFPGQEGAGILFEWDPLTGSYTPKVEFDGSNGGLPVGNLSRSGGRYYGMTSQGGDGASYPGINIVVGGSGIIFEWDAVINNIEKKIDLLGLNGAYPTGNDLSLREVPVAKGLPNACETLPSVTIDATNNNKWVPVTDNDGQVVAEINANGNNLGLVAASIFINDGNVREDGMKRLFLDRSITITPAQQPLSPVSLRLYIRRDEFNAIRNAVNSQGQASGISQPSDLAVFKLATGCSDPVAQLANRQATLSASWSNDIVYTTSISEFSTFYFASASQAEGPLPVQFISFTAELQGDNALLKWQTTREENIQRYDVERSTDGINYIVVGNSNAANTTGTHSYSFTDVRVTSLGLAKVYYRIREVDVDGRSAYTKEVMLNLPVLPARLLFYPNPVTDEGQLKLQSSVSERLTVRLMDHNGRVVSRQVWQSQPGVSILPVSFRGLAGGMYLVEVISSERKEVVRVLKR